jgi:PAS domain-containing protein
MRRRNVSPEDALKLVDDASAALQYNRDILQHAIDFARQGITVFDRDLRLICSNREFRELFDLPSHLVAPGVGLDAIVRHNAMRGLYGPGPIDEHVTSRLELLVNEPEPFRLRLYPPHHRVLEIRSARLPDGGIITTFADVTRQVEAEEALEANNETLERRVLERTQQ